MKINILEEIGLEGAFVPGRFDLVPSFHPYMYKQKMQLYTEFLNHKRKLSN